MPTRPRTGTSNFRHEHHHALQDKSGSDRVSFKVKSRAADPNHTPLFFKGDIIKGEVQFDPAKVETLTGLTITVCAFQSYSTRALPWPRLSALTLVSLAIFLALNDSRRDDSWLGQEEKPFLGHNQARVDTCVAERRQNRRPAHVPASRIPSPSRANVVIAPVPKVAPTSFPLPPTFSKRASPAYIDFTDCS